VQRNSQHPAVTRMAQLRVVACASSRALLLSGPLRLFGPANSSSTTQVISWPNLKRENPGKYRIKMGFQKYGREATLIVFAPVFGLSHPIFVLFYIFLGIQKWSKKVGIRSRWRREISRSFSSISLVMTSSSMASSILGLWSARSVPSRRSQGVGSAQAVSPFSALWFLA
jgi:hypothetical protein